MWFLNKTTQSITAICAEAATTALQFVATYYLKNGRLNIGTQTDQGTLDDTLKTVVPTPGTDEGADVRYISVNNTDNVAHNLTFNFSDGTDNVIFKCKLEPNWTVIWTQENGWIIFNDLGIKQ